MVFAQPLGPLEKTELLGQPLFILFIWFNFHLFQKFNTLGPLRMPGIALSLKKEGGRAIWLRYLPKRAEIRTRVPATQGADWLMTGGYLKPTA